MSEKIRRIRCGTPKCTGFFDTNVGTVAKSREGNWQFHCTLCGFWSLLGTSGVVKATSREQFDLDQLPPRLRMDQTLTREPPGGV
jgi:hypothetical protein